MITNRKLWILLLGLFLLCTKSQHTFAQDSSLIKFNYMFSYDYHDYTYYSDQRFVKTRLCYSNKLGIQINHYFFKKKRWGGGLQLMLGNKQMNVSSDYNRLIYHDRDFSNAKYENIKSYEFKYDFWLINGGLKVSYLFKNKLEPWIGFEGNYYLLHKQNFAQDTVIVSFHGVSVYPTYVIPQNLLLGGVTIGVNFLLKPSLIIGLTASQIGIPNSGLQGESESRIMFDHYKSIGLNISYKIF